MGSLENIEECAENCRDVSSMFAFGTNDFGTTRCNDGKCACYCETAATSDGSCTINTHNGYRLYSYFQEEPGKRYLGIAYT